MAFLDNVHKPTLAWSCALNAAVIVLVAIIVYAIVRRKEDL